MTGYVLRRILLMAPLLWAVATVTFLLMHAIPGGPFDTGDIQRSPEVQAAIEARYGLDEPLGRQYLLFLGNLAQGDLGVSFQRGVPVTDILRQLRVTCGQLARQRNPRLDTHD